MAKSFLGLEGFHVLITGAGGGIGGEAVREFLRQGCLVTGLDLKQFDTASFDTDTIDHSHLHFVQADLTKESEVITAFQEATSHYGKPPQILVANAGITNEQNHPPIWEMDVNVWDNVSAVNLRGTFLTIKHFLLTIKQWQEEKSQEIENLAIVVTGSECGKFGQEGHAEYATGKAGLNYGLVRGVKNEIVRMNTKARINAVAPGWVDTPLIGDRLDDPKEFWAETQATVALKKIAKPTDVACAMAFLASHRAAGHISGQCLSVDGGMEGRLLWKESDILGTSSTSTVPSISQLASSIPKSLSLNKPSTPRKRLRIALSVDFDALSGYLGTGQHPSNTISDYSAGLFSARVGVPRLLTLFHKHSISNKITWFIPGHSMESFPTETTAILKSGAEIALHGYSHEGAYQMTPTQERDVLEKCITLATKLTGHKPTGYRAPLYQIRETTVSLLREHGFLYDSSMNAHDSLPYFLPEPLDLPPAHIPDWSQPASTWMHPLPQPQPPTVSSTSLVEIPTSWYTEDMTPLGFYPYVPNSQGYVSTDVVEKMWWDRFLWLWENEAWLSADATPLNSHNPDLPPVSGPAGFGTTFTLIMHPESAGRAHIVGMIDRFIGRMAKFAEEHSHQGEIVFETYEDVARAWKECSQEEQKTK